ncbi:uncharacterized protein LOC131662711 [Phymastichus coffea]|uniref:uncharacterized protein LOC131662711 n=1 Tax=Phymastichus coffea TaxID=108790 RepID=UPI00273A7C96|nr:uncharacterized protein LOC131662711 [Phymastichus coffea]
MIRMLFLLLTLSGKTLQDPIFKPSPNLATSVFKGLPNLPSLNKTAGETRMVYYHEQVIAVVDVLNGRKLLHCELIEVYEPKESEGLLRNLSVSFRLNKLTFKDIMKLMDKCDKLDENPSRAINLVTASAEKAHGGNPLLIGIIPGTKWCGTGDIAKSYHDLGTRTRVDRCCRAHDLCPVKIRAYRSRYNLTNNSFFSKSHCTCDETFYNCLKSINHVSANIIGNIYFNIAQPPCVEDETSRKDSKKFVPARRVF